MNVNFLCTVNPTTGGNGIKLASVNITCLYLTITSRSDGRSPAASVNNTNWLVQLVSLPYVQSIQKNLDPTSSPIASVEKNNVIIKNTTSLCYQRPVSSSSGSSDSDPLGLWAWGAAALLWRSCALLIFRGWEQRWSYCFGGRGCLCPHPWTLLLRGAWKLLPTLCICDRHRTHI